VLAYVNCKAPNILLIVGGRKVEHLRSNISALKIKLTDKRIEYLGSLKPFEPGFPTFIGEGPKVTSERYGSLGLCEITEAHRNGG
jgi:diketogulonate reductase-like aldo/keto reductase